MIAARQFPTIACIPAANLERVINLRQLRYFAKVVEVGNMTRAAEQLNVAQPALGLHIRQLERDIGVLLLVRHSRGVEPTPAGRLLFERARTLLQMVEAIGQEVRAMGGDYRETVTLGLAPSIMLLLGSDIVVDAQNQIPQVALGIVEELSFVLAECLERGELDMALAYEVAERPGLVRVPLHEEDLLLITTPENATPGDTVTLAEALQHELVMPGERDLVHRLVVAAAERLLLPVNLAFQVQSVAAMKSLVKRGVAASIMPYGIAAEELRQGTLVARRIEEPAIKRILYLVRPAKRGSLQNEAAFMAFLQRVERTLLQALGPLARPIASIP